MVTAPGAKSKSRLWFPITKDHDVLKGMQQEKEEIVKESGVSGDYVATI